MRFHAFLYVAFLAIVARVLYLLPGRARKAWLLTSSYAFYASWSLPYLGLLVGVAALNCWGARWIERGRRRTWRAMWILAIDLLVLVFFKYVRPLRVGVASLASLTGLDLFPAAIAWVIPLGISYYLLETIGYIVEVARRREVPRSFVDMQLFVAFFPKLIVGPIVRAGELLPQVDSRIQASAEDVVSGIQQIIVGLFLKVVLAAGFALPLADLFSRDPATLGWRDAWVMAVAFGIQLYLTFAGYARIARGSARLFGIHLMDNFQYPYSATSVAEFWSRWHVSLWRWLEDYVRTPLVGLSPSRPRLVGATLVTMIAFGLWHGPAWTLIAGGAYQGLLLAAHGLWRGSGGIQNAASEKPRRWHVVTTPLAVGATFGAVSLGWLLFRSETLSQGLSLMRVALSPWAGRSRPLDEFTLDTAVMAVAVAAAGFLVPAAEQRLAALSATAGSRYGFVAAIGEGFAYATLLVFAIAYWRW